MYNLFGFDHNFAQDYTKNEVDSIMISLKAKSCSIYDTSDDLKILSNIIPEYNKMDNLFDLVNSPTETTGSKINFNLAYNIEGFRKSLQNVRLYAKKYNIFEGVDINKYNKKNVYIIPQFILPNLNKHNIRRGLRASICNNIFDIGIIFSSYRSLYNPYMINLYKPKNLYQFNIYINKMNTVPLSVEMCNQVKSKMIDEVVMHGDDSNAEIISNINDLNMFNINQFIMERLFNVNFLNKAFRTYMRCKNEINIVTDVLESLMASPYLLMRMKMLDYVDTLVSKLENNLDIQQFKQVIDDLAEVKIFMNNYQNVVLPKTKYDNINRYDFYKSIDGVVLPTTSYPYNDINEQKKYGEFVYIMFKKFLIDTYDRA